MVVRGWSHCTYFFEVRNYGGSASKVQSETCILCGWFITKLAWSRWWRRGSLLAHGDCSPGFDSQRGLKFFFHSSHRFSTWVSFNSHLERWGLSSLSVSVFFVQLANITPKLCFPSSSWVLMQSCAKITNGLVSVFTITASVGTQLSGQNRCCLSPMEVGMKKYRIKPNVLKFA